MKKTRRTKYVTTNVTDPSKPYLTVVVGLWDRKAETYIAQQFVTNVGVGIRDFTSAVNDPQANNNMYKWPDDYELHTLGVFNPRTGGLEGRPREILATGENVKIRN